MTDPAPLLILHLSDLHFGNHNRFADQDPVKLGNAFSRAIDHTRQTKGIEATVQLVIVSGDAVELGKPKEFEQAEAFLVALAEQFGLDATRFVFSPGNHDLSWPLCEQIASQQKIEDFDETELRQRMDSVKFKFYDRMLAKFYGQPLVELDGRHHLANGGWLHDFSDLRLSVAALNTCERESHRPKDHGGYLSEQQAQSLMDAWRQAPYPDWLKIVVVHHNPIATTAPNIADWTAAMKAASEGAADLIDHYAADVAGFTGCELLRRIVRDCRAHLVLHGHHHDQGDPLEWPWAANGRAPVLSTGSWGLEQGKLPGDAPPSCQLLLMAMAAEADRLRMTAYPLVYNGRFRVEGDVLAGNFVRDPANCGHYDQTHPLPAAWTGGGGADILPPTGTSNPRRYLRDLRESSGWIDIRGLQIGKGRTNRFPIEQLYISLTSSGTDRADERGESGRRKRETAADEQMLQEPRDRPLQEALRHDRLVVVGAPGGGKTTFLRRICHALCQTELGEVPQAAEERLEIADRTFPVFVRINELAEHILKHEAGPEAPAGETARWLPHFLASVSGDSCWGLDAGYFQQQLEDGRCTVLLDGLDEAPRRAVRERMSRVIRNVTAAYGRCRFVVTSRPAAYTGQVVLAGFAHAHIDPLSDEAVATFLSRWCAAVYPDSERSTQEHCDELLGAVRGRAEIRRMARNPMMLTALAVVHWTERRLPEQRADLYDSIITWLSRSREQRPGRMTADRCVVLLQELALAMQDAPEGRQTQVSKRWAAEQLVGEMGETVDKDTLARAETFLDEEEVDSGIVVGRGSEVANWHLTFQEFLAAKAIGSRLEEEQHRLLFTDPDRVYLPEWREVMLLLCGALHKQGKAKVDGVIKKMLDGRGKSPALADQARCVGLIGAILRDLSPMEYRVSDSRYPGLLSAVMAIFDRDQSQRVPIEERIAAADALGQSGDSRIDFAREDYWGDIPGRSFLMGAQSKDPSQPSYNPEAIDKIGFFYGGESPVHEVVLSGYRISRYPITVSQFQRFLEDEGYQDDRWWTEGGFGKYSEPAKWEQQIEYPSRPVVGVSWWEAAAFCAWSGSRLPTEAEWEFAARGAAGRKYPWGNKVPNDSRMNYDHKVGHATPVGIFPRGATPAGVLDMGGNVWEWCWDEHGKYSAESMRNPSGGDEITRRVLRGGDWRSYAQVCRTTFRYGLGPEIRSGYLGFRVTAVPNARKAPFDRQRAECDEWAT